MTSKHRLTHKLDIGKGFRAGTGGPKERELTTTTTLLFLPFGYGRHACPGRWFAAQLMKQALAYIMVNYGLELVGKPIKIKALLSTMVSPVDAHITIWRKV
jgi:cytochrome P450